VPALLRPLMGHVGSLVTVPIGGETEPLGMLLLGHASPHAFDGLRWQMRQQVAAMGVLRLMRQQQVEQLCCVLVAIDEAADPLAAISTLLRVRGRGGGARRARLGRVKQPLLA
jgi:hypothetical protein